MPKGAVIGVLTPTSEINPRELEERNNIEKDELEVKRYMESFLRDSYDTVIPSVINVLVYLPGDRNEKKR